MKKRVQSVFAALLVAVIGMLAYGPKVLAAEASAVEVPVKITLSGTLPGTPEQFTIRLEAEDAANPMPEGSEDGVYTMEIRGAGEKSFPVITYTRVGIYNYEIYQEAGKNGDCTYDRAVYRMTVYVTNAEAGGLESTTVLYKDNQGNKLDKAAFHNTYKTVSDPEESGGHEDTDESAEQVPVITVKPSAETETPEAIVIEDPGSSGGAQTGDNSATVLWSVLIVIAACTITVIGMSRKKNEKTEE